MTATRATMRDVLCMTGLLERSSGCSLIYTTRIVDPNSNGTQGMAPRNDAATPGHVCPGIRIHAMDIVQPPGIGISPIADMDAHQMIVTAALAAKSDAMEQAPLRPKRARVPRGVL